MTIVVRRARKNPVGHYFTDSNIPCHTVARSESYANVPVRDHSDDLAVCAHDGKKSAVPRPHQFRCGPEISVELTVVRRPHHYISCFHWLSPFRDLFSWTLRPRITSTEQ